MKKVLLINLAKVTINYSVYIFLLIVTCLYLYNGNMIFYDLVSRFTTLRNCVKYQLYIATNQIQFRNVIKSKLRAVVWSYQASISWFFEDA